MVLKKKNETGGITFGSFVSLAVQLQSSRPCGVDGGTTRRPRRQPRAEKQAHTSPANWFLTKVKNSCVGRRIIFSANTVEAIEYLLF